MQWFHVYTSPNSFAPKSSALMPQEHIKQWFSGKIGDKFGLLWYLIALPMLRSNISSRDLLTKYSSVPLDILETESHVDRFTSLVDITMATKLKVRTHFHLSKHNMSFLWLVISVRFPASAEKVVVVCVQQSSLGLHLVLNSNLREIVINKNIKQTLRILLQFPDAR